jgi:hypothetical protein
VFHCGSIGINADGVDPGHQALNGFTGLELDGYVLITGLTTVWDGSRIISSHAIQVLAGLSIET